MYILFEGIDTTGKSTQIDLISQKYPEVVTTYEPGATAFGKSARDILLADTIHSKRAELLLFLADRAEHYTEVIEPNLDKTIISDRGFISGIGYALANEVFNLDELISLNKFALQGNLPDKIVMFTTDMPTLKERTSAKPLDGIELRGLKYLMKTQKEMLKTLEAINVPFTIVDSTNCIEDIHEQIIQYLDLK